MKKRSFWVVAILIAVLSFTSCGMGWENFKKDFKSDIGGGLKRSIVVSNMLTGEIVWEYEGIAYIDDKSTAGDITIMYRNEFGEAKKADFIGNLFGVYTLEK